MRHAYRPRDKLNLISQELPEIIHKAGSTRYKYLQAVWVEEIWDLAAYKRKHGHHAARGLQEGKFYAYQAGRSSQPAKLLAIGRSLDEAVHRAARKAEDVWKRDR